jgi:hypothetical protein
VDAVRNARLPTIAVNDAYRLAPWADVLYAADAPWWQTHKYVRDFAGERWTQNRGPVKGWPELARAHGLHVIESRGSAGGWPESDARVCGGGNSGFMAVSLACISRAKRVVLLGFDMGAPAGRRHFFGDHPGRLNKQSPYHKFVANFEHFAPLAESRGIDIINCTRGGALNCFRRMGLDLCLSTPET